MDVHIDESFRDANYNIHTYGFLHDSKSIPYELNHVADATLAFPVHLFLKKGIHLAIDYCFSNLVLLIAYPSQ